MEPFTVVEGIAAPLPAANIDTDVIMPKMYLKGVDRGGLVDGVFHDLRFEPDGAPNQTFILNQPAYKPARFLVVGPNFGCGSSREHAVWGLRQFGIRALIGTSFAGIFFDNCARNGLLALTLPADQLSELVEVASDPARNRFSVDLDAQTIVNDQGGIAFTIEPFLKAMLLKGLDAVGMTLDGAEDIERFEERRLSTHPWLRRAALAAAAAR